MKNVSAEFSMNPSSLVLVSDWTIGMYKGGNVITNGSARSILRNVQSAPLFIAGASTVLGAIIVPSKAHCHVTGVVIGARYVFYKEKFFYCVLFN